MTATIALPIGPLPPPVAAEAPDGAVFVGQSGQQVVWVVDGDQAPAVAEHVTGGVRALAADASTLYAGSYDGTSTTIVRYDRTTGSEVGRWTLPVIDTANTSNDQLLALTAAGGYLWASIVAGNNIDVFRATPGSPAVPVLLAQSLGGAAVSPDGSLYMEGPDQRLVRRAPSGQLTVGPKLANIPNGLGGGVQYIDRVAGGQLWVDEPAGQGLDAGLFPFDPVTLASHGSYGGNMTEIGITDTSAGPVVLSDANGANTCPGPAGVGYKCVFRMSAAAVLSDPTPVGPGVALLGPYPAVVTTNAANNALQLDRLA